MSAASIAEQIYTERHPQISASNPATVLRQEQSHYHTTLGCSHYPSTLRWTGQCCGGICQQSRVTRLFPTNPALPFQPVRKIWWSAMITSNNASVSAIN